MVTVAAAVARRRFKAAESWPTGAVRGGVGERWAVSSVGQQSKRRCLSVRVCCRSRARARSLSRSLSRALSLSHPRSLLFLSRSPLSRPHFTLTRDVAGPDHAATAVISPTPSTELRLDGFVLALRGSSVTPQPLRAAASGSALLWNGEIFAGAVPVGCPGTRLACRHPWR